MKGFESYIGEDGRTIHVKATQTNFYGGNNQVIPNATKAEMHIHHEYAPARESADPSTAQWMQSNGIPPQLQTSVSYFIPLFHGDAAHRLFIRQLTEVRDPAVLYTFLAFTCLDTDNHLTMSLLKREATLTHLSRLLFHLDPPELRSIKKGVEKEYELLRPEYKK